MATPSQIAANRENAQSSTGPRTESGKTTSSHNALTFGLYTRTACVRPEEQDRYQEFCETLYTELDPEGLLEQTFVAEITGATWRLRRCDAAEAELDGFDESTDKTRRSVERARAHAHSVLYRSVNQLRRLQTERACRLVMNAVGDDGGIADYKEVVVAANNYEKGKHLHAKTREMNLASQMASICEMPDLSGAPAEDVAETALASNCKPTETPRNAPCPCNSGKKYKHCCARTGAGWPSLSEAA